MIEILSGGPTVSRVNSSARKIHRGQIIRFFFFLKVILKYIFQNVNVHFIIYLKGKNQTKNKEILNGKNIFYLTFLFY